MKKLLYRVAAIVLALAPCALAPAAHADGAKSTAIRPSIVDTSAAAPDAPPSTLLLAGLGIGLWVWRQRARAEQR